MNWLYSSALICVPPAVAVLALGFVAGPAAVLVVVLVAVVAVVLVAALIVRHHRRPLDPLDCENLHHINLVKLALLYS